MDTGAESVSIDELLDRAVTAFNSGDRATATALAGQILAVDSGNPEAEDLLAFDHHGEIRRLTMMFVDLVDSTGLSTRVNPEIYRRLVGGYRDEVRRLVNHYGGHVNSTKGDGVLALFGHPTAHEDDALRAVAAGLDITRAVARLSDRAERKFGVTISVRVGIHRGVVYLDIAQDDVYGFTVNLADRISALAEPGSVSISDAVAVMVGDAYELRKCQPAPVKGVDGLVSHHRVLDERAQASPLPSVPLIGRDLERAWLEQAWRQALEGELSAPGVAFRGEAGIGKTRLARAAAEMVERSGATVVELRGSPLHADTGLHPFRRLLERNCAISRLTSGTERLRRLEAELRARALDPDSTVPILAPVLGVGPEHGYRQAVFEGPTLYELIRQTAQRYVAACLGGRAGLVIAEDVHWFDASTMELLTSILASADGRLMVVMTGREGEWLRKDWPVMLFELAPLTDKESDALIEAMNPSVTDAQRTAVRERCDGVPFYIEHVVGGLDAANGEVPEVLYQALFARMHTGADVVPVVEAAAVIGRSGDRALLSSVLGGDAGVDEVITGLTAARVLERTSGHGWRFRHELLREVAAELAPPSLRRDLHARTAQALVDAARGVEPDWRAVAAHFEQAHRFEEAVNAYHKASMDARRRGAAQEALAFLSTALEQLAHCPKGADRDRREIAIRLERGFMLGAAQGSMSGEAPADFERCLELATVGMHEDELFQTLTAMVSYYHPRAELHRADELLESLSGRIAKDRPWTYPAIASSRGTVAWLKGDFVVAREHLVRALQDRSAADPRELDNAWWVAHDPISAAHVFLALTEMASGDLDGAEAELAESVRRCDTLEFPRNAVNRAHTYFHQTWVCLEAGQLSQAADFAADMRRCTEAAGLDLWRVVSATQHATIKAMAELRAGADADTLTTRAHNIALRIDASRYMHLNVYLTFHDSVIGRLLIAAGKHDMARERLDASLRHAEETGMHFHDAELMRVRAHTLKDTDERRHALSAALEFARRQDATLFQLRCLIDSFELLGNGDGAQLAHTLQRMSSGRRWPEYAQAERILA